MAADPVPTAAVPTASRHGIACAIAFAALLLRLLHVDTEPLWFDEGMTVHIVHEPTGLAYVHNTPPLYYWLLRAWSGVFGISAVGLRSFSAVAGALFVWATFHAARCTFGHRAAVPAALFALLSPIHLYYSQEARAYALLLLLLMVVVWTAALLAKEVRRGPAIVLVAAGAAALYTHYLAAIPLALTLVLAALGAPAAVRRRAAAVLAAAAVAMPLLLLPWLLWWWQRTPFESRDMNWLATLWQSLSSIDAFTSSLELLLLGGQQGHSPIFLKQFGAMPFPDAARCAGFAAASVLVLLLGIRSLRAPRDVRVATLQCTVLFVGPVLTLLAVSTVHPVWCPGRYDLIALPGLLLLLGGAAGEVMSAAGAAVRWLGGLAAAVLALVLAAKDVCYFAAPPTSDPSPAVAQLLAMRVQPDETVVLCGPTGVPVLAQLYQDGFVWSGHTCRSARTHTEFGCRLLPEALEAAPGSMSRWVRAIESGELPADLQHVLNDAAAAGVWLVLDAPLVPANDGGLVHPLLDVLREQRYEFADARPQLGVVHVRRPLAK